MSRWFVVAAFLAAGTTYWYRAIHKPWADRLAFLTDQPPPRRTTQIFVTGAAANTVANAIAASGDGRARIVCYAILRLTKLVALLSLVAVRFVYWYLATKPSEEQLLVWIGENLRAVFERMGGAFIKLGQWSATRSDLFSDILCKELEMLQADAPPHSYEETLAALEAAGVADKFVRIAKKPMNSGSIGQVHRAWLKREAADADVDAVHTLTQDRMTTVPDDEMAVSGNEAAATTAPSSSSSGGGNPVEVVVKVQHPGIVRRLVADALIVSWGAWFAENCLPGLGLEYNEPAKAAEEFASLLMTQLDFRREAENLNAFRFNFRKSATVVFPRPFLSLSSQQVLVETYEPGVALSKLDKEEVSRGGSHEKLSSIAIVTFLDMVLKSNLIHADLHPGNLLARFRTAATDEKTGEDTSVFSRQPESAFSHSQLVILDPGIIISLSPRELENFVTLFSCVAVGDGDVGAKLLLQWKPETSGIATAAERDKFIRDMKVLFDEICPSSLSFSTFDISYILHRILSEMRQHRVSFDMSFATLLQAVALSESVGKCLCAHQNVFAEAAPFLVESLLTTGHGTDLAGVLQKLIKKFISTDVPSWIRYPTAESN